MTLNTDAAIQLAVQHMQAGRWSEGERLCREILTVAPNHAGALHFLGVALAHSGQLDQAVELICRAIKADPNIPEFHSNLAKFLCDQSQPMEAIAEAQRAIQLLPGFAAAWGNLGHALHLTGRISDAANAFAEAARLRPDVAEYQALAGRELVATGQAQRALQFLRRFTEIAPEKFKGEAYYDLGVALATDLQFEEAIAAYRHSLQINPTFEWAWNNLGNTLKRTGRLEEAAEALQKAVQLKPEWGEAYCNLAGIHIAQGDIESARKVFDLALPKAPEHPVFHFNHGVFLLLQGNFDHGWREYEWRWKCEQVEVPTRFDTPPWRGAPLEGRKILLHAEQGFGDTIQFSHYIPMVAARGGEIYLCIQPELLKLFKNFPHVRQITSHPNQLPSCDEHCYLMDLPLAFNTREETIPNASPHFQFDPLLKEKWLRKISQTSDLKVGISWAGRPTHVNNSQRSMNLSQFAPLSPVPGIQFYSLQKGTGSQQSATPPGGMNWTDLTPEIDDFADTAALISHLDLVITVDSAVAHLAAATGKPVWILIPFAPDWRWMLKREDSPWYPTARLFRQPVRGDWASVLEKIRNELAIIHSRRDVLVSPGEHRNNSHRDG